MKKCYLLLLAAGFGLQAQNTTLGTGAGTGGAYNVFIGKDAGTATVAPNGNRNTFVGFEAGISNTSGRENTYVGDNSGRTSSTASENTMVGRSTGHYHSGSQNTFIGFKSGMGSLGNSTGSNNSFFGYYSGTGNTTGEYNTFIGRSSGYGNTTGGYNTSIGTSSGYNLGGGANNVFLGYGAGLHTNANNNVFIGYEAGKDNSTGTGNVFVGFRAGWNETGSNKLYIFNNYNTPLIYGEFDNRKLKFYVSKDTLSTVEIQSSALNRSGLKFTNLKSTYNPPAAKKASKFLTVDSNGTVVLMNINTTPPGTDNDTSLYLNDGELENTINHKRVVDMVDNDLYFTTADTTGYGRIYIGKHINEASYPVPDGLDSDYRLFVEKGILTEKVKVALRDTSNWADYVFSDTYDLKPLSEVAAYIEENKHLPGVPSAKELKENGLDLGDMQAKQMEKIEELTLHVIRQESTIDEQNRRLSEQERELQQMKAQMQKILNSDTSR